MYPNKTSSSPRTVMYVVTMRRYRNRMMAKTMYRVGAKGSLLSAFINVYKKSAVSQPCGARV